MENKKYLFRVKYTTEVEENRGNDYALRSVTYGIPSSARNVSVETVGIRSIEEAPTLVPEPASVEKPIPLPQPAPEEEPPL